MVYVIQVCWQLVPSWSCSQAVNKPLWHVPLLCVLRNTPDDGQRDFPKHVGFYSQNKFEKLVHLVGFIIRIYHDARSPERQIRILVISQFSELFYFWGFSFSRMWLGVRLVPIYTAKRLGSTTKSSTTSRRKPEIMCMVMLSEKRFVCSVAWIICRAVRWRSRRF